VYKWAFRWWRIGSCFLAVISREDLCGILWIILQSNAHTHDNDFHQRVFYSCLVKIKQISKFKDELSNNHIKFGQKSKDLREQMNC